MKVTYIAHSGVAAEYENTVFLFDYYMGNAPEVSEDKQLFVFCSHFHGDHFNPEIFKLYGNREKVKFILSNDIRRKVTRNREKYGITDEIMQNIVYMKADEMYVFTDEEERSIRVQTVLSTDAGVAFLVTYRGKRIYHAGDLNLWVWEDNEPDYDKWMRGTYLAQIKKLAGKRIDLAFLPIDGRLEKYAFEGAEQFLKINDVKNICPIHMDGNFDPVLKFIESREESVRNMILPVTANNMTFEI